MNNITYKGLLAHIHFDERDKIFVGRIPRPHGLISFHADSDGQLRQEFKLAVESFLAESLLPRVWQ